MGNAADRKITLTLDAQTSGKADLDEFAAAIDKIGKKGGEAKPEFEALADEMRKLGDQRGVVTAFDELTAAAQEARAQITAAKNAVTEQTAKLDTLKLALDSAKEAQEKQNVTVRSADQNLQAASQAYDSAKAAIARFVATIGGAKKLTDETRPSYNALTQAVREAKASYLEANEAVRKLAPTYEELQQQTKAAASAVKEQQSALSSATKDVNDAQGAYDKLNEKLTENSARAQKLGVDLGNVAAEQNRLTQAISTGMSAFDNLKTKLDNTGKAALTASQRIEQAFAGTGVKSANQLQAEISQINQAMLRLAKDTSLTEYQFDSAFAAATARTKELEAAMNKAQATTKSFGGDFGAALKQFGPAALVLNGVTAAIYALGSTAAKIPQVTAEFQTLTRTLTVLTGSSAKAAQEFEYIKGVANRVGTDIKSLGTAYAKLTAATKETALAGGQTRRIFESISGAMGTLGASSAEAEGALQAVTQMVSKGVVSQEEMRQQLGERLPGALQAMAKELGLTTADLNDLIASGKLAAEDALPALAAGLEKVYDTSKKNNTLIGQWNEYKNALKNAANAVGDSGLVENLLKAARYGSAAIQGLGEDVVLLGRSFGMVGAAISTGDWKGAWDGFTTELDGVNKRIAETAGATPKAQKSISDLAKEAQAAGKEFFTTAEGQKFLTASVLGSSEGFIKLIVESDKAQKSAEGFATSARKAAEYTRSSGEAAITAANAIGTEAEQHRVAEQVALDNAKALEVLLEAEKKVTAAKQEEALIRATALRDGKEASDQHVKELKELGDDLDKRKAVTDGIQRQAEAQRLLAESLRIKTEMDKDNSGRLDQLRQLNADYTTVLAAMRVELDTGRITQEGYNKVKEEASKVNALYNDSMKDSKEKIVALNQAKQAQLDVERAGVNLSIEQQRTYYELAKARGDEYGAAQAMLQMKRLEIQLSELTAKAKRAEAQVQLEKVKLDREELKSKGLLTEAKAAELRAAELSAGVKMKEADIADELAKRLRNLANQTAVSADTASNSAGNYDSLASSMNSAADAAARLRAEQASGSPNGDTKSILDDPAVRGRTNTVDTESLIYARNPNASVEEVKAAVKYYGELYARGSATKLTGNLGSQRNAAVMTKQVTNDAIDQALKLAKQELASGSAIDLGDSVNDLIKKNLATTDWRGRGLTPAGGVGATIDAINSAGHQAEKQTQNAMTTVNIRLNNQRVQVTTDQQGAKNLTDLFRTLENDASRTF